MTVKELMFELSKLDPNLPVCGESETCCWDIQPSEIVVFKDVKTYMTTYPKALILGYVHSNYEEA